MIAPATGAAASADAATAADRTVDPALEKATLDFERVLLTKLLEPLAEAAGEEAPAAYKDLLPQTLADAVAAGGGIGLAAELQRALLEERR